MPAVTHTVPVHRVRTAWQLCANVPDSPWYTSCPISSVMERALGLFPVVSAAAGYLLDGVVSAASGLLIPLGPLILAWLLGTR